MLKLGATASSGHMVLCRELETIFRRQGIDLQWVLYSTYDGMVEAFGKREIDLAWNGPLSYVKIKRLLDDPCQIVAMRDVDLNFATQFITHPDSDIATVEDLPGKRFALGSRGSPQAGLLASYFLKQVGIDPQRDLAAVTYYEERQTGGSSDEEDVVQRVRQREYDAGAVSRRTLETLEEQGSLPSGSLRVFWSSPGYSHCCFTAHSDLDAATSEQVTEAFLSIDARDPAGQAVLEAEDCQSFVRGTTEGWETLEIAAEEQGLL